MLHLLVALGGALLGRGLGGGKRGRSLLQRHISRHPSLADLNINAFALSQGAECMGLDATLLSCGPYEWPAYQQPAAATRSVAPLSGGVLHIITKSPRLCKVTMARTPRESCFVRISRTCKTKLISKLLQHADISGYRSLPDLHVNSPHSERRGLVQTLLPQPLVLSELSTNVSCSATMQTASLHSEDMQSMSTPALQAAVSGLSEAGPSSQWPAVAQTLFSSSQALPKPRCRSHHLHSAGACKLWTHL